jgi:hypothetical protein
MMRTRTRKHRELAGPQDDIINLIKFFAAIAHTVHEGGTSKDTTQLMEEWGSGAESAIANFGHRPEVFRRLVKLGPKLTDFDNLTESQWASIDRFCEEMATTIRDSKNNANRAILSYPQELLTLFATVLRAIYSGSEPAYRTLKQKVGTLGDLRLSAEFTDGGVSGNFLVPTEYKSALTKIGKHVKKWAKIDGTHMPQDARNLFRERDPEGYKEFLATNRIKTETYKDAVRHIVRTSGKPTMDIKKVASQLDKLGIHHTLPVKQFVGQLDDSLKFYTSEGERLNGVPVGDVRMNPDWDTDHSRYYCEYKAPGAAGWSKLYQENVRKERKKARFAATRVMVDDLDKYRKRWRRDMKANDLTKALPALLCEIAYMVSPRIGTTGNRAIVEGKEVPTYGLSTIMKKHVKATGSKVTIEYVGKAGEKQSHVIEKSGDSADSSASAFVIGRIRLLLADKKPNDLVFTDEEGRGFTGQDVNRYLKSIGSPITFHGFRKVKGSYLMRETLNAYDGPNDGRSVNAFVGEALKAVGEALGHFSKGKITGNTALKSYVDGDILLDFYEQQGVAPTATIDKAIRDSAKGD